MGRRTGGDAIEFGSDSFLDIIANIVGILIILIVVAGVRVSHAPPPAVQAAAVKQDAPTAAADSMTAPEQSSIAPDQTGSSVSLLRAQVEALSAEVAALLAEEHSGERELERLREAELRLNQQRQRAAETLEPALRNAAAAAREVESQRAADQAERAALAAQLAELESLAEKPAPVIEIRHELTPVSRTVDGPELHFRLADNRVARLPIEELKELLKRQIDRDRQWLMKVSRHVGSVGPVRGFSLEYLVERQPLSALDELRYGRGLVMVGVTRWRLKPEADLPAETAEVALRPGSAFDLALKTAEPGTTVTLWVYPDSFALFRQLQTRAHKSGYEVAARPLPFGVFISGSPEGTKSAAQ